MLALDTAAKSHSPDQGGQIIPLAPCDVTKKDDLERMYQELASKEKYINLLIAAAVSQARRVSQTPTMLLI